MTEDGKNADEIQSDPFIRSPIIALYGFLGPPVGGIFVIVGFVFAGLSDKLRYGILADLTVLSFLKFIMAVFMMMLLSITVSYPLGFIQAFFSGVILAECLVRTGAAGYLTAILAPLAIGLLAAPIIVFVFDQNHETAFWMAAVGIVSSVTLRFIFRGAFAKR